MSAQQLKDFRPAALLFWQYLVLGGLLGVLALVYPFHALFCFALLCLWTVLLYARAKGLRLLFLLAVFAAAHAYAAWREPVQTPEDKAFYSAVFDPMEEVLLCGKVEKVQGASDRRLRITLSGVHAAQGENCRHTAEALSGKVLYTWDSVPLGAKRPAEGQYVRAQAKLRPFYGDLQAYYARQNIWYGFWNYGIKNAPSVSGEGDFWALRRETLRHAFAALLFREERAAEKPAYALKTAQGQAKAILMALFFGDKFYLTQDTLNAFNAANLLHSLALSGQHLSLAAVLAACLLFLAVRVRPYLYERFPRPHCLVCLGLVFGFLYCWIGSAPYSLLRAYAMLALGGILYLRAKELTLLDVLFYALAVFLLLDPLAVYDLGVQLSFACVFAIAFMLPLLRFAYERYFKRLKDGVRQVLFSAFSLFCVSLGIQFAVAPLLIVYFGQVSWFFVLNVLWLPFLTFWVMPLALLGFLCMGLPCAEMLLQLAYVPVSWAVDGFAALFRDFDPFVLCVRPMGLAFLGFYLLLFVFLYARGKADAKSGIFAGIGLCCLFVPVFLRMFAEKPDLFVSMLDVGQGQAVYIETKDKRLFFDVGGTSSRRFNVGRDIAAKYAAQNRCPSLDLLAASHDDSDHINGIAPLLRVFSVELYCETAVSVPKKSYAKKVLDKELARRKISVRQLGAGDYLDLGGGFGLEILYPPKDKNNVKDKSSEFALEKYSANNSSLMARLVKDGKGLMLLCGDSENAVLDKLSAMYAHGALRAEVLVLPHHGSANSYNEVFYAAVRPERVWASCGKYNRWGFPAGQIRAYFAAKGIPVQTTADEGDLYFVYDGSRFFWQKKTFLQELYSVL